MKKYILILLSVLTTSFSFAQKRDKDTLDTEVINVVKPYSPTVSDAFKIKVSPIIDDASISKKRPIQYTIFSVPVASTFTPAKGKPKALKVNQSPPIYENFISAGFGSFGSPQFEIFANGNSNRYNEFGGFLNFHSSNGGIDDTPLDNNFLDAKIDVYYKQDERDFDWQLTGGFRYQQSNWYGLPELPAGLNFSEDVINSIDESLNYIDAFIGGKITYDDSFFQGASADLYRFTDDEGSTEIYANIKPKIEFPIGSQYINMEARIEFLAGEFFQNYEQTEFDINYTYFNLGITPNFEVLRDNLTINLGANIVYSAASGVSESKAFIYPKITASYILIDQILTLYAGVVGDLEQNSFKGFAYENPFVSPTLNVLRTDRQYDAYGGLKGKLASNISYNLKGGYMNEKGKPLFKLNQLRTDGTTNVTKGYEAGNSFQVVYDEVQTLHAFGEVSVDFSKQLKFGGNVSYFNYSTDIQAEAWGLPTLKATAFANYNQDKWYAGADLFFVGSRNDELTFADPYNVTNNSQLLDVGNYIDLNLKGGYKFSDRLTAFSKVNNLFSSNYEKYTNFEVQGLQFFAGLTYKFDL